MPGTGLSDTIAGFVAGQRFEDLPASTVTAAKRVLLDASGAIWAASGLAPEVEPFIALARSGGAGPCAILGTGHRASAPMAALANGAMAHAIDYEDAFDRAPGHPNASLVPALIALAQAEAPVDGRRLITALAVGCEVSCRMGLALRRPMEAGGWYPPPILAGFGAVAGAANLLGLSAGQVRDALSLMLCQMTMPGEIKHSPTTVIRAVREAFPAQAAVQSVLLARGGVAGFEAPLEGKAGFFALYAGGEYEAADLTQGLGENFLIEQLTFKPWPSCRGTHAAIELALDLRATHGIDPARIKRIEVECDGIQRMLVEPLARKAAPANAIDAKFSIPFTCALALVRGRVGLDDFDADALHDPAILGLAARIVPVVCEIAARQPGSGGALRIEFDDGRVVAGEVANARGCPERTLAMHDQIAKFVACLARAREPRDAEQATALAGAILSIDRHPAAGALFA